MTRCTVNAPCTTLPASALLKPSGSKQSFGKFDGIGKGNKALATATAAWPIAFKDQLSCARAWLWLELKGKRSVLT